MIRHPTRLQTTTQLSHLHSCAPACMHGRTGVEEIRGALPRQTNVREIDQVRHIPLVCLTSLKYPYKVCHYPAAGSLDLCEVYERCKIGMSSDSSRLITFTSPFLTRRICAGYCVHINCVVPRRSSKHRCARFGQYGDVSCPLGWV